MITTGRDLTNRGFSLASKNCWDISDVLGPYSYCPDLWSKPMSHRCSK